MVNLFEEYPAQNQEKPINLLEEYNPGPTNKKNGLITQGNIDLNKRPIVKNPDGSYSTVYTMGISEDGKHINIPRVSDDGKVLSEKEAVDQFHKTGKHLGIYDSQASADNAAQELHNQQAIHYGKQNSENPEDALELAKKQISQQYPNLPDWLRDAILKITPKQESPMLGSAARGISRVSNIIPAAAGGLLQGASIPIRGVAGLIPSEFTQKLANSPDLTNFFQKPETEGQQNVQNAAELIGGGGAFGKLFQGAKYAAQAAKIPKVLQNATALTTAGTVGTPGDAEDRTLGGAEALGLGAAGKFAGKLASGAPKLLKGLFSPSTTEDLVQAVQKPHDVLENAANELYGQVQGAINGRKIKIPISEELLEQAKEHFPKNTRSYNELIEKARAGDYDAIHKIQSSLYKKGTKALSSDDLSVENQGEDILDLRNKINDELSNKLIQEGHLDIAHVLSQGKKLYSELQNTYFPKHLRKGIGKMVHPETRLVPEKPENLFNENSVPMKEFLNKHPEVKKHSENIRAKKKAEETLKKILLRTGGAGATIAGGKAIYDLFD